MTSAIFATDHRVRDFDDWLARLEAAGEPMRRLGVRHVVVYRATEEPNRVFVTVGVHTAEGVEAFVRSEAMRSWFDAAGEDDLPPVFVGHVVEKLDLQQVDDVQRHSGVVVASLGRVDALARLTRVVHERADGFRAAGVWRYWSFQAFDDPTEVMLLQQLADISHTEQWMARREEWATFVAGPGVGVYPSIFIGTLVRHLPMKGGV